MRQILIVDHCDARRAALRGALERASRTAMRGTLQRASRTALRGALQRASRTALHGASEGVARVAVLEARDGLAGLQRAVEEMPDLIVLRDDLPGLGGRDLSRRLAGCPGTASIPVLIWTGGPDSTAAPDGER